MASEPVTTGEPLQRLFSSPLHNEAWRVPVGRGLGGGVSRARLRNCVPQLQPTVMAQTVLFLRDGAFAKDLGLGDTLAIVAGGGT